ncbi:MAG: hypothetical protein ACQERB_11580 [Promethearchaeati archaeon]
MTVMNHFINKSISENIGFTVSGVGFFLDNINIEEESKEKIRKILEETKRLPAALRGYHGGYIGGLYDHSLLVTNFAYQIWNLPSFLEGFLPFLRNQGVKISSGYHKMNLSKILQTALSHDFGKIPYYGYKRNLQNRRINTTRSLVETVSSEIKEKFDLYGKDSHVDQCIAVLKKYHLPFDDEISLGIIFHHGRWAKYRPFRSNKLSELIHIADMIASHYYKI